MLIGSRVKEYRKLNNLTQEELANALGIKSQAIHKYEKGIVTNIPLDKLEQMAKLLGCSPEYLVGWSDKSNADTKDVDIFAEIRKKYGEKSEECIKMFLNLDNEDKAEIKGEIKNMLKSEKYKNEKESLGKKAN